MHTSFRTRTTRTHSSVFVLACLLSCCLPAIAAKEFVMPDAHPARTYPAHDEHSQEKVTIAVDPYDVEYKASIFTVNYHNYGLMPVFFVVTNDSDQPVALSDMKVELVTVNRSKLSPASTDELVRRLSHPRAAPPRPSRCRFHCPAARK